MLKIKEVNEYNQFIELREKWNNTLKKSRDDNIFLTWEWLSTWWKHYGKDRELMILLAEDKNEIVAVAPFMYSVYKLLEFKLRKIEFMGTCHTDYCNFILAKRKAESLELFLKYLSNLTWDCLELKEIPESAESILFMRKISQKAHIPQERVCGKCPYINLPASWETFFKELSGNMRRNLRRRMKRLREKYKVEFTRQADIESLQEAMRTFVYLHEKRWKSKGLSGSFGEDPKFCDFLLDVSKCFAERNWLNLSFLTINDKPISSALCFEYNKTLYYYHPGFDPAYSKFSVGNLLIMHLIEDSIRKGITKFDFLKGAESYKYDWTALSRNNIEVRYIRNRLFSFIYDRIKRSNNPLLQKLKNMRTRYHVSWRPEAKWTEK